MDYFYLKEKTMDFKALLIVLPFFFFNTFSSLSWQTDLLCILKITRRQLCLVPLNIIVSLNIMPWTFRSCYVLFKSYFNGYWKLHWMHTLGFTGPSINDWMFKLFSNVSLLTVTRSWPFWAWIVFFLQEKDVIRMEPF